MYLGRGGWPLVVFCGVLLGSACDDVGSDRQDDVSAASTDVSGDIAQSDVPLVADVAQPDTDARDAAVEEDVRDATDDRDTVPDIERDVSQADAAVDGDVIDSVSDVAADAGDGAFTVIRGQFESGGPVTACRTVNDSWNAPDGLLMRMGMDVCGDDMEALADTIVANLDAAHARGGRALLALIQGINIPDGWLAECDTYSLSSGGFVGDICLPWDTSYLADLTDALENHVGPAVAGHPALAGVYFTTPTMTNGVEMHFRVSRPDFSPHPGDAAFTASYIDIMDVFQAAFDVPVVFEAGHCIFDTPGGDAAGIDCETPRALYHHARDTYGRGAIGLALWNCAERFWHGPTATEDHVRALLEEATRDGVSMGCQSVGNFTEQPCRFTDPAVADYGERVGIGRDLTCVPAGADDAERACVDTLDWFAGLSRQSPTSVVLQGTWLESWTADVRAGTGIVNANEGCAAAVSRFAVNTD